MQVQIMKSKDTIEEEKARPESAQTEKSFGGGKKGKNNRKKQQNNEDQEKAIKEFEERSKNVEGEITNFKDTWAQEKAALMAEKEDV